MVLFVPRSHTLHVRVGMATGQWQIVDLLSCLQGKADTFPDHPIHMATQTSVSSSFLFQIIQPKSSRAARLPSCEFVRKNEIKCTITKTSQQINLSIHHSPTSLSHKQKPPVPSPEGTS